MKIIGLVCLATALSTTAYLRYGAEERRTTRPGIAPVATVVGPGVRGEDARHRANDHGGGALPDGAGNHRSGNPAVGAAVIHAGALRDTTIESVPAAPLSPPLSDTVVRIKSRPMSASDPLLTRPPLNDVPSRAIAGTRVVELSPGDLAMLGIVVDSSGIFSAWIEEGRVFSCRLGMGGMEFPVASAPAPDYEPSLLSPSIITDDRGGMRMLIMESGPLDSALDAVAHSDDPEKIVEALRSNVYDAQEKELLRMRDAGGLVPVLVRTGRPYTVADSLARRHRPDCIYWYRPTQEFLALLPGDVRSNLSAEILRATTTPDQSPLGDEVTKLRVNPGTAPYLDVLRGSAGGVLNTTVLPNPAGERAEVGYSLSGPRVVTLALHDIMGRRLRELKAPVSNKAGDHHAEVDFSGLDDGIYLLVISTDRGEQAVQRVIHRH